MNQLKLLLFFVFSFVINNHFAQENFDQAILEGLRNYQKNEFPEKIYIHTDKSFYANDDTIWFSLYLVNGVSHQKSTKSLLAYAELLNANDSIIDRKRLYTNSLSTPGNFNLQKGLQTGIYKIRGFTNYMQNQNSNYFFEKEITIWSSDKKSKIEKKEMVETVSIIKKTFKPDLNFYPQGGYLVNNLMNKVAIKLKNDIYDSVTTKATIKDENGEIITSFKSTKFGLGEFSIIPKKGKKYVAEIKVKDTIFSYELPKPLEKSYVLNVVNNNKQVIISLNSTTLNGLKGASLVAHQRGKFIYSQQFNDINKSKILRIPVKHLKNGIVHLTLFDSNKKPVCERLVFINKNDLPEVLIEKEKDFYTTRKKVLLKLDVKNSIDSIIPSKLSLSVKDVSSTPKKGSPENIQTWLLLNSDLRGKIKNPTELFNAEATKESTYLLDLVMLTHGWRRFTWQKIVAAKKDSLLYKPEVGFMIKGNVKSIKKSNKKLPIETRITFPSGGFRQESIKKVDSLGNYSYGPFVFFDSIPVIVEARLNDFNSDKKEDRKVIITPQLKQNEIKIISKKDKTEKKLTNDFVKYFSNKKQKIEDTGYKFKKSDKVLNEVIVKSKLKTAQNEREKEMSERTSYGNTFYRTDLKEVSNNFADIFNLLATVSGLTVLGDQIVVNRAKDVTPLIFYNELPIEAIELNGIPASEVSFVDVLVGADANLFSTGGPVVLIYAKKDSGGFIDREPGITNYKASGFYMAQEFYAPDHINGIEEQSKPDIRTTLHWEPNIIVTKDKKVEISFFTSDIKGEYIIEIEGITVTGKPLYKTTKIFVE